MVGSQLDAMEEVQVALNPNYPSCIIREEHINPNVVSMPVVHLPKCYDENEDSWISIVSHALHNGQISENWLLEAYGRAHKPTVSCLNFVGMQYIKHGMKVPPKNFLNETYSTIIHFVDYVYPEFFFQGLTDVVLSNDKYYFTYQVHTNSGSRSTLPIGCFDVYQYFPAVRANYEWLIRHPGLTAKGEQRPSEMEYLWDELTSVDADSLFEGYFSEHWAEYFGHYYRDVAHMGIWAMLMWLIKPDEESLEWRKNALPVYDLVSEHGECVFSGGSFYVPHEYDKLPRPAGTCNVCEVKLPCAEVYNVPGTFDCHYFCKAHAPKYTEPDTRHGLDSGFNCATCDFSGCPNRTHAQLQLAPRGRGQMLIHALKKVQKGELVLPQQVIDITNNLSIG